MTADEITERIKKIEQASGDDEAQHSREDKLYYDFIKFIADTELGDLGLMAKLVLTTKAINFARWCS